MEEIEEPAPKIRYPVCLAGERACPPEDCGGISGYERVVDALADPLDPEHDEFVTWAPDGYDPARFDADSATRAMQGQ